MVDHVFIYAQEAEGRNGKWAEAIWPHHPLPVTYFIQQCEKSKRCMAFPKQCLHWGPNVLYLRHLRLGHFLIQTMANTFIFHIAERLLREAWFLFLESVLRPSECRALCPAQSIANSKVGKSQFLHLLLSSSVAAGNVGAGLIAI